MREINENSKDKLYDFIRDSPCFFYVGGNGELAVRSPTNIFNSEKSVNILAPS